VWGSSKDDLWVAVGRGPLLHRTPEGWRAVSAGTEPWYLYDLDGSGPSDVWGVGSRGSGAVLVHWDGQHLVDQEPPDGWGQGSNPKYFKLAVDGHGGAWVKAYLWPTYRLVHWNGQQWLEPPVPSDFRIADLQAVGEHEVYVLGDSPDGTWKLGHWKDSQWTWETLQRMEGRPASFVIRGKEVWFSNAASIMRRSL
jgi:hypothetical protein